jgi:DNA-binding response OmpR family regulator
MHESLKGKKILIVKGSLIANEELQEALAQEGARPFLAHNVSHAFDLVERIRFDGVIVDHGLHNEAFDLCTELQAFDIPYIFCSAPHRLQGWQARKRDAEHAVCKLAHVLTRLDGIAAEIIHGKALPRRWIAIDPVGRQPH